MTIPVTVPVRQIPPGVSGEDLSGGKQGRAHKNHAASAARGTRVSVIHRMKGRPVKDAMPKKDKKAAAKPATAPAVKAARHHCSICHEAHHNARSCPKRGKGAGVARALKVVAGPQPAATSSGAIGAAVDILKLEPTTALKPAGSVLCGYCHRVGHRYGTCPTRLGTLQNQAARIERMLKGEQTPRRAARAAATASMATDPDIVGERVLEMLMPAMSLILVIRARLSPAKT